MNLTRALVFLLVGTLFWQGPWQDAQADLSVLMPAAATAAIADMPCADDMPAMDIDTDTGCCNDTCPQMTFCLAGGAICLPAKTGLIRQAPRFLSADFLSPPPRPAARAPSLRPPISFSA